MKVQIKKLLALMLGMFLTVFPETLKAQQLSEGYELVWSDEFDKEGTPNSANWTFENGFVRNQELQWYQKENAWCEGGLLVIEGRREQKVNPNFEKDSTDWRKSREFINYTSSSLNSKGLQSFQYGIIEVKAKIKTENGLWPAIWTLGNEGEWPATGECDILEFYQNNILANFAWGTSERFQAKWDGESKPIEAFQDPTFDEKFHLWKLHWTEKRMQIYLDDILMNEVDLEKTVNPSNGKNPFRQPHYILLNLAIGSNGGDPSSTTFPTRYEVDYVRVYQMKSDSQQPKK